MLRRNRCPINSLHFSPQRHSLGSTVNKEVIFGLQFRPVIYKYYNIWNHSSLQTQMTVYLSGAHIDCSPDPFRLDFWFLFPSDPEFGRVSSWDPSVASVSLLPPSASLWSVLCCVDAVAPWPSSSSDYALYSEHPAAQGSDKGKTQWASEYSHSYSMLSI